jgi:hypothetical protein
VAWALRRAEGGSCVARPGQLITPHVKERD